MKQKKIVDRTNDFIHNTIKNNNHETYHQAERDTLYA